MLAHGPAWTEAENRGRAGYQPTDVGIPEMETIQVFRKRIYHTPDPTTGTSGCNNEPHRAIRKLGRNRRAELRRRAWRSSPALLRTGLDGAGIDPGMSFMLRRV